jgi:hypothetical protein
LDTDWRALSVVVVREDLFWDDIVFFLKIESSWMLWSKGFFFTLYYLADELSIDIRWGIYGFGFLAHMFWFRFRFWFGIRGCIQGLYTSDLCHIFSYSLYTRLSGSVDMISRVSQSVPRLVL